MSEINKKELYGQFTAGQEINQQKIAARDRLHMTAAHKALDIPEPGEEMGDINANKTTNVTGLGLKELVTLGLLATGIGGGGLAAGLLLNNPASPLLQTPPAIEKKADDSDTQYEIGFAEPRTKVN